MTEREQKLCAGKRNRDALSSQPKLGKPPSEANLSQKLVTTSRAEFIVISICEQLRHL